MVEAVAEGKISPLTPSSKCCHAGSKGCSGLRDVVQAQQHAQHATVGILEYLFKTSVPRPSIYPLLDPKYPSFGTIYPYLRVLGGSWYEGFVPGDCSTNCRGWPAASGLRWPWQLLREPVAIALIGSCCFPVLQDHVL